MRAFSAPQWIPITREDRIRSVSFMFIGLNLLLVVCSSAYLLPPLLCVTLLVIIVADGFLLWQLTSDIKAQGVLYLFSAFIKNPDVPAAPPRSMSTPVSGTLLSTGENVARIVLPRAFQDVLYGYDREPLQGDIVLRYLASVAWDTSRVWILIKAAETVLLHVKRVVMGPVKAAFQRRFELAKLNRVLIASVMLALWRCLRLVLNIEGVTKMKDCLLAAFRQISSTLPNQRSRY